MKTVKCRICGKIYQCLGNCKYHSEFANCECALCWLNSQSISIIKRGKYYKFANERKKGEACEIFKTEKEAILTILLR